MHCNRTKLLHSFSLIRIFQISQIKYWSLLLTASARFFMRWSLLFTTLSLPSKVFFNFKVYFRPGALLSKLDELASHCRSATNDVQILSVLYGFAEKSEQSSWIQNILLEILVKASRPWLDVIDAWLGLSTKLPFTGTDPMASQTGEVLVGKTYWIRYDMSRGTGQKFLGRTGITPGWRYGTLDVSHLQ